MPMPRRVAALVTAFLCLAIAGALPSGANLVGPDYTISPGDALMVQVYGEPELSKLYPVGPAGTIILPMVGQVTVADLTLEQARKVLTQKLGGILRAPRVVVGISEVDSVRKAYVLGYVGVQGPVNLHFGAGIVDALAVAGTLDTSDLRKVQVTHPGQAPITLDLSGLRTGQPVAVQEKIHYGDVIYVPRLEDRIAVLGEVKTPGSALLPLGQKVSVLDAIARVGGGLTAEAALSKALLVHENGETTSLDLAALLKAGDTSQNVYLQPGDALVVPQVDSISVVGQVAKPLSFRSAEPVSVLEALAQAGGFTAQADLAKAQVVSASGQVRGVDLQALWERGDQTQNVKLSAGDVLLLPEMPPLNLLIVGSVAQPGVMDLQNVEQRDLLRVVTLAGVTPQSDLSRVQVYRGEERFVVNLEEVMQGQLDKNMQLAPDDVVMVPERSTVYVFGAVARQGKQPWTSRLTILDCISDAGGLAPRANENATVVMRIGPEGQTETIPVPLGELKKGHAPENIKLAPGDIVYVPSLGERGKVWALFRDILWGAGAIIGLTR